MNNSISIEEAKKLLNRFIDNNRYLEDNGQTPVAVSLEGTQGIGKTAIVQQVAESRGMNFVKLSLHEFEEVGDLVGYPVEEYMIKNRKTGQTAWVSAKLLQSVNDADWKKTTRTQMSYAQPEWVPEFNENGTILLLDDYARSSSMLIQATMELINTGKYVSWSLPKYSTVVLTANPDNGEFNVQSLDAAQRDRFVKFDMTFDIQSWARWAERAGVDGRAINFALSYADELFKPINNVQVATPRGYVTFCKSIAGIKDWKSELDLILLISRGCFNDKDGAVGRIFNVFINNGYDKLVGPQEIFEQSWDTVYQKLAKALYQDPKNFTGFNPAIGSMLATRIVNWLDVYFSKPGYVSAKINDRLLEMMDHHLFTEDLIFFIIKATVSRYPKQTAKLLLNPNVSSKIVLS